MKAMNNLDRLDRQLLNLMQNDFPLTTQPYLDMARKLDISENEVLKRIQAMKQSGIIRRTGAILDARKMGFYSTLCTCRVEEERIDEVAAIINGQKGITHNYVRDHYYNVWFTLTAPSYDEAMKIIRDIQQAAQVKVLAMPAIKTYKIKVSLDMGDTDED
jgi:DNA-binding Lrp family transcriptional regulator